jgi:hypothetical protein
MGCLFALFSIITPRLVMILIFLFTHWFSQAFYTFIWPLLGFIFMPYTTLAYMVAMIYNHHQVSGGWLVVLIIAVIVDVGGQGGYFSRIR